LDAACQGIVRKGVLIADPVHTLYLDAEAPLISLYGGMEQEQSDHQGSLLSPVAGIKVQGTIAVGRIDTDLTGA